MNCPKCGVVNRRQAISTVDNLYDPVNKVYFRRCRCNKCKKTFYTVEFEIECEKELLEAFDFATPPPNAKVESSKKRFEDYRATQKKVKALKRWGVK